MDEGRRNPIASRVAVFVTAVAVAIGAIAWRGQFFARPQFEEANVAIHLLRGEGFATPYYMGPGIAPASAFCAPGYPLLIAACYLIAPGNGGVLLLLINAGCMGMIALCVYELGIRYVSASAGILAATLVTLHPAFLFYAGDLWDAFVALALFMAILWQSACLPDRHHWLLPSGLLGAAMGLLCLTNASYAFSLPLVAAVAMRGRKRMTAIKGFLITAAAGAIVVAPWTIRNVELFHRLFFVRDSLKFELFQDNPNFATGWVGIELRDRTIYFNDENRYRLLTMGELPYFDLCGHGFTGEYYVDPAGFWRRTVRRMVYVFLSDPTTAQLPFPFMPKIHVGHLFIDRLLLHGLFAVGSIAGAWTASRLQMRCAWIFFAGILTAIPFMFCSVDDRYVLPLRAILIFFTALLLWAVGHRLTRGDWPAPRSA